ncbi:putative Diguanylate cyclase [uncultured Stenotrophomonas sp.]|uniref:diguanylate cyclase n=1 Tax=uncultured Stenotrophomonas sp. TaxID=165438 RepID=A0A1Y5Q3D1_9GAMM|nr:putative Diguanylate cyclase [uncultured Stenotrophomonas sp.]
MKTGRPRWPRVLAACGLWLLLQTAQAAAAMHGLPLMRHFGVGDLPAAPFYSDIAVDAQGTLYAGSSEGVMVFHSGLWELFELPHRAAAYTVLAASDGRVYVGGSGVLGELQREPDGDLHFIDLLPEFTDDDGKPLPPADFYGLLETARGIVANDGRMLYRLRRDGGGTRQPLPEGAAQLLFVAGGELYVRIAGTGVCRLDATGMVPLPGTAALDGLRLSGLWEWKGGLLYAASDGFHFGDAGGVHKLPGDADAAFAAHVPYSSIRLPDGGFAFGSYDGTLMRFSPELQLLDSFMPARGNLDGFGLDRDGGLWAVGESGLTRLRLPSPWTVYDQRHGLFNRLHDSAWYDGSLWVAALGLWRAGPATGGVPRFLPQPWADTQLEVFALQGTGAGLVVGDRLGLMVLDPGAKSPRRLVGPQMGSSTLRLLPSAFDPERMLALGSREVRWLAQRDGRWQLAARWPIHVGAINGIAQVAPGEFWVGDERGGVHRWRFDARTGQLHDQQHFDVGQAPLADDGQGTHLVRIGEAVYAITGSDVRKLAGEHFVPASLPVLPGLERPWELEAATTALGSFVWTTRQLWWRRPGESAFHLQQVSSSRVPGFAGLALQGDGRLRLVARDSLLQFDPDIGKPSSAPLQARLDRIRLRQADRNDVLLPLQSAQVQVLPPGSGLALRFGLATMEPDVEFRYRMLGYNEAWSPWGANRDLGYRLLPPGDYRFELQARIRGGRQAEPLLYRLRVEPFWYERGVVQALFWVAGLLLLVLAVRLRNRSVNARNRELERRIAERTGELEAANRRLTELAVVDGLTGIANRHAMERALQRGWQRCGERGEPLAVVMADVDHFKEFNDNHGHQAGDMQLCRVAAALAAEVSGVDELAVRYGGEEFVLILPGVGREAALQRAERVRQRAARAMAEAGMPGSISLGVAVRIPAAADVPGHLVHCADLALYRAKHAGRNRVECADEADFASAAQGAVIAAETVAPPPAPTLSSAP